jgi:hypothetical protein
MSTKPTDSIEISIKGKWMTVPALRVDDNFLIVKGSWVKTAVVEAEEWLESEIADPESYIRQFKAQRRGGLKADIFTFAQKLPSAELRYKYLVNWESMAVAPITSFNEWWTKLPQETRKNVRRSQKRGVTVCVKELDDSLIDDLIGLNNDSPMRQGKRFYHYGKTREQVWKDQESFPGRSGYICAYVDAELIGVLKLVYRGDSASILTLLSKPSHADRRPANALLAKAVEVCESKGISYLVYGKFNYGNKRDSSLKDFKIRHGFDEILLPRYYVPLTVWGRVCMGLGIHRGLIGVLPPRAITLGNAVRAKFYKLLAGVAQLAERPNRNRQVERSIPPAGSNS